MSGAQRRAARRGHRHGRRVGARATTSPRRGQGLLAGGRGVRHDRVVRPVARRLEDRRRGRATSTPSGVLDRKDQRRTDRYIQFGLVVARQALDQAGLPGPHGGRARRADGRAPRLRPRRRRRRSSTTSCSWPSAARTGSARSSSRWASPTSAPGQIAISFGMLGPNFAIVSACATGAHAIGEAWETIRRDDADIMLAGGSEAAIHEAVRRRLRVDEGALDPQRRPAGGVAPVRPAAATASSSARARACSSSRSSPTPSARGAEPLAELVGYGATADAAHITLPAPGGIGAVRAGRRALEKAGIAPDELDHVNAHATSTPEGDGAELQALRDAPRRARPGGLDHGQQVDARPHARRGRRASSRSRRSRRSATARVPPTINLDDPDQNADGLDLTPIKATRRPIRDGAQQLVRVRRPERGARLPAVGRMSDDQTSIRATSPCSR